MSDHFVEVNEMVEIGSGAKREVSTMILSSYACYLIVQNADTRKLPVALAQTYFAIQTCRAELLDLSKDEKLTEDERRRLFLRS